MFKTSPERRAAVRRSKQKNKREKTEAETKAQRAYFREYRRKHAHKKNEQRRARRARHAHAEKIGNIEVRERYAGLSIVTASCAATDATRWRGPAWKEEERLEKLADAILARSATRIAPTRGETEPARESETRQASRGTASHKRAAWPTGKEKDPWQQSRRKSTS